MAGLILSVLFNEIPSLESSGASLEEDTLGSSHIPSLGELTAWHSMLCSLFDFQQRTSAAFTIVY